MHLLNLLRGECGDIEDLLRLLQAHPGDAGGCSGLLTGAAPGACCCLARCEGKTQHTQMSSDMLDECKSKKGFYKELQLMMLCYHHRRISAKSYLNDMGPNH